VFLAVLDAGSTLAASKALGMAQPTVARRIDALGTCHGPDAVRAGYAGAQPTLAARELEAEARAVAGAIEGSRRRPRARRFDRQADPLTAPKPNFSENLAKALADFTDMHPSVRFEFVASMSTSTWWQVRPMWRSALANHR
jgi:DNA-binding transcriptional LysR family regulator